jgi:pilus assembly protein CpaE
VTSDWDAARTAVNLGKPIANVKPKSALVMDVDSMIRKLAPEGMIENSQAGKTGKRTRA